MRIKVTLDQDIHEFAWQYARENGLMLSKAIGELVRKGDEIEKNRDLFIVESAPDSPCKAAKK
jgi:hypothetical protein